MKTENHLRVPQPHLWDICRVHLGRRTGKTPLLTCAMCPPDGFLGFFQHRWLTLPLSKLPLFLSASTQAQRLHNCSQAMPESGKLCDIM